MTTIDLSEVFSAIHGFGLAGACAVLDQARLVSTEFEGTGGYWPTHQRAKELLVSTGLSAVDSESLSAAKIVSAVFWYARRAIRTAGAA